MPRLLGNYARWTRHAIPYPHHYAIPPTTSRQGNHMPSHGQTSRHPATRDLPSGPDDIRAHAYRPTDVHIGLPDGLRCRSARPRSSVRSTSTDVAYAECSGHHAWSVNPTVTRPAAAALLPRRVCRHALFVAPTHASSTVSKFDFRNIIHHTVGTTGCGQGRMLPSKRIEHAHRLVRNEAAPTMAMYTGIQTTSGSHMGINRWRLAVRMTLVWSGRTYTKSGYRSTR